MGWTVGNGLHLESLTQEGTRMGFGLTQKISDGRCWRIPAFSVSGLQMDMTIGWLSIASGVAALKWGIFVSMFTSPSVSRSSWLLLFELGFSCDWVVEFLFDTSHSLSMMSIGKFDKCGICEVVCLPSSDSESVSKTMLFQPQYCNYMHGLRTSFSH